MTKMLRLIGTSLFLVYCLGSGCSTVAPLGATGAVELAQDEKRIWTRSQEESKRLDESGQLYTDPEVSDYVNQVALRLVPAELRQQGDLNIRVRIVRNPLLNAFALSHGAIYIHTGILAKLENEAQLATLLAHELTHITNRHPVRHFRTVQNWSTAVAILQIAAMPAGPYGGMATLFGALGATASVRGYSRSMETEADSNGLDLLVAAGYDPSEAPKLFEYLQKDLEERKIDEPFFFGSHPKLQERKENYSRLLATSYAGKTGEKGATTYAKAVYPVLCDNAWMDLSLGRWTWAEEAIRRAIAIKPDDPAGYYELGELFRRRAQDGDQQQAAASYQAAMERDDEFAPAHRGLGLVAMRSGDAAHALNHFQRYLALAPRAEDKLYIEQYIATLTKDGATR